MHFSVSAYPLFGMLSSDPKSLFQLGISFLLLFSVAFLWMKTFRRPLDRRIPVFKFPPWSVSGNISHVLPSTRFIQQASLNINAYFLQCLTGLSYIYPKEDVICVWIAFRPFIILNKVEVVEEMMRSNSLLDKSPFYRMVQPLLGLGLLTSGGSRWREKRKLLTPTFHFDILNDFLPVFNKHARILVEILKTQCHKDYLDLFHYASLCALDIICESTLGVQINAQLNKDSKYVQCVNGGLKAVMDRICTPEHWIDFIYYLLPVGRQFNKESKYIQEFTMEVIRKRKAALLEHNGTAQKIGTTKVGIRKRKAFLDLLLDIHLSNQSLSEEDIREEVATLVTTGYETTAAAIGWALYLLGLHPDIQAKVSEELDQIFGYDTERELTRDDLKEMHYLECVIKESLRLYPSVPLFGRLIQEDGEFHGYRVRKGTTLVAVPHLLHRDPGHFPDPEKFDPSRFFPEECFGRHPYAFIPFSAGPRNCIGQRFSMMEEKILLAHVLRNFVIQSLEPRDRVISAGQLVLHPVHPVKIKLTKRNISFNSTSS